MVLLANHSNVGDLGRTVLGKRFDVMKLDVSLVLNLVVIDKAIKHSISALLCQNLLLLGIGNLSLDGRHSSLSRRKSRLTVRLSPQAGIHRGLKWAPDALDASVTYSITTQFNISVK
jgi:hypothetical protein